MTNLIERAGIAIGVDHGIQKSQEANVGERFANEGPHFDVLQALLTNETELSVCETISILRVRSTSER